MNMHDKLNSNTAFWTNPYKFLYDFHTIKEKIMALEPYRSYSTWVGTNGYNRCLVCSENNNQAERIRTIRENAVLQCRARFTTHTWLG